MLQQKISVSIGTTLKLDPNDPKCFEFVRLDVGYERDMPLTAVRKKEYEAAWSIVEEELMGALTEMRAKVKQLNKE